jgi:hypothetical protein
MWERFVAATLLVVVALIVAALAFGLAKRLTRRMAAWRCITLRIVRVYVYVIAAFFALWSLVIVVFGDWRQFAGNPFGAGAGLGIWVGLSLAVLLAHQKAPEQTPSASLRPSGTRLKLLLLDWAIGSTVYVVFFLETLYIDKDRTSMEHWLSHAIPLLASSVGVSAFAFLVGFAYTSLVSNAFARQVARGLDEFWLAPRRLQFLLVIIPSVVVLPFFLDFPGAMAGLGWRIVLLGAVCLFGWAKPGKTRAMIASIFTQAPKPPAAASASSQP